MSRSCTPPRKNLKPKSRSSKLQLNGNARSSKQHTLRLPHLPRLLSQLARMLVVLNALWIRR